MRVLILNRYSLEDTTGGVAEYLHYLPLSLKKYAVDTLIYNEGDSSELSGPTYLQNGTPVYSGPFVKPSWFVSAKKLQPLIELCRVEKIDLIHAQGTYRSGYVAMQLHKKMGIPYIVTSHADIVATNSDRMKRDKVQRRCREILRQAAGVTHLTPRMAEISHAVFDTHKKSVVIGNGIDLAGWRTVALSTEKNYVLGMGRLVPEKGFHVLIDAYASLRQMGVTTSLVIAGSGSEESTLHHQVKKLGLNLVTDLQDFSHFPENSVIFTGYVKNEIKKKLIAESQMILFPTQPSVWEEPFGIVQIEAMAAGKAMIASDSATTRYLQTLGLQTMLVKADDNHAWADAIKNLLDNESFRKKSGQINLEHAAQFDWDIIAKQYKEIYLFTLSSLNSGSKNV